MKKAEKRRESIKTLIIAVLFLLVILMVYLHFEVLRRRNNDSSDTAITNDFAINSTLSSSEAALDGKTLIPSEIAFKDNTGNTYAISSGKDYMMEIYSLLEPDILYMLGNDCTADSASESAFDGAISSENFIYVRYHTSLPAILLFINALENNSRSDFSPSETATSLIMRELIIFPDSTSEGSAFAFSKDEVGNVTKFTVKNASIEKTVSIADLVIYREAGAMVSAKFHNDGIECGVLPSTLVFDDISTKPSLDIRVGIEGFSESAEMQAEFAELLAINPNKTGNYFDSELGGTVYMATHGTLTFTDKSVTYSTESNTDGIALSHFSGKENDEEHSVYECLSVAIALANAFSEKDAVGIGEAEMLITGLYRVGDKLTVNFGYFYDNIPISDTETALSVEMTAYSLTSLKFSPIFVTSNKAVLTKPIPGGWVIALAENTEKSNGNYTLVLKYRKSGDGMYSAEWVPVSYTIG